ncbi:MAG: glucose 1-dehydrogenase [Rhizobiales bacterium]|nr:glucose 1-dehydrogenase [Hyphomicrobiales bacterium]
MSRFAGRVVVVTGAGRGIGYSVAERFASEGARVVLSDRSEESGRQAARDLVDRGYDARFVACDVAERLDVMNLMAAVLEAYERVDVLVNNAGILDDGNFLELDVAEFDKVLAVNLRGAFLVGQAVSRQLVRQVEAGERPGSVVNMASVNAHFALPDHIAYSISKAGIQSLTKGMALALAPHGIRVNAIGPGSIMTPMLSGVAKDEAARRRVLSRTPLGRIGLPEEVAAVAAFLASDDASYITGETIFVDGGRIPLNYVVPVREQT